MKKQQRHKILVVDDDPGIVDMLSIMLVDAGYQAEIATDTTTVEKLKTNLPDLILLDIWMSGIDGGEICKQLKKQEETKNIPIIMISANKDTELIANKSGANDFIVKPFEMNVLLTKVKNLLEKSNNHNLKNITVQDLKGPPRV
jgi:DNA-binding response OmpR family regulator